MAKYRITSLPQSLPKAQKGLFNKRNKISSKNGEVKLFPTLFGNRKKNNVSNQDQSDNTQYNWSGTTPELIQPGVDPFELKPTYTPLPEVTQNDINLNTTLDRILKERQRLAQEKETRDWEEMMKNRSEKFKTSNKYDKIEPLLTIDSEGYTDEDIASFEESGYFPVKDSKTNKINLYPINEISSRIINNGLRTNEIVNKLGIGDAESIKNSFGDLMTAADEQYSATVQNKLLKKSLDEGISLEDAAKQLSGKLGTEEGIQKYVEPTNILMNKFIDEIKGNVNEPTKDKLQSMYYDNRTTNEDYIPKINYNSYDPQTEYNLEYYRNNNKWGDFLKNYSDYIEEYKKAYENSFYKENTKNKNSNLSDITDQNIYNSDRTSDLKNKLDDIQKNISLNKRVNAAIKEAGNKTLNKNYLETLQNDFKNISNPIIKGVLSKKLDATKNNPVALSKLLKSFESGEVLSEDDQDYIGGLSNMLLQKQSSNGLSNNITYSPELSVGQKISDVLTNPFDAFRYANTGGLDNMWGNSSLSYNERKNLERGTPGLDLGTEKNNFVGNFINTWNPLRLVRDMSSDIDRGDYASAGLEALEFASPWVATKALRAAKFARDANKLLGLRQFAPGTRAALHSVGESLTPYFAYEGVRPGGDFNRSYDAFKEGNITEGLKEGAWGLLNTLPALGALKGSSKLVTPTPYIPQQLSYKKGGVLPKHQGWRSIVKPISNGLGELAIKALQIPGVKPFFRSNYNPISYPIKLAGEKIARYGSHPTRTFEEIKDSFRTPPKYFGQDWYGGKNSSNAYGLGKRDLIANYFRGIDTGFKPIEYDIYADSGLDKYIKHYGPLKTYELNSQISHGEPLHIDQFSGSFIVKDPNLDMPLFNRAVYDLHQPDINSYRRDIWQSDDFKNFHDEYENSLLPHETSNLAEAKRLYYKENLNKLFDHYGLDEIPIEMGNDSSKFTFITSPNTPYDNIGGHMAFLKRHPNRTNFDLTTRDIWKFLPSDYNARWLDPMGMSSPLRRLQIEAMDTFGKPFVLTQTNPIHFKKGGSMELELTPQEIKKYVKAGYIIEDV